MKSYTDITQSKKLAEILPIESADMSINHSLFHNMTTVLTTPYKKLHEFFSGDTPDTTLPCWSLAALLNILPHCIDDRYNLVLGKLSDNKGWYVMYDDIDHFVYLYIAKSDLIDACVEMIIKLHEEKLL
jgi:hypothetical protein